VGETERGEGILVWTGEGCMVVLRVGLREEL
jgi:hypothetical protein